MNREEIKRVLLTSARCYSNKGCDFKCNPCIDVQLAEYEQQVQSEFIDKCIAIIDNNSNMTMQQLISALREFKK